MAELSSSGTSGKHVSSLSLAGRPRPTGRALLLLAVVGFLAVQSLITPHRVWYLLLVSFSSLLGISYLWALSLARNVRAGRRYNSELVQVGDRLSEDFTLENQSILPAPWLEVRDESTLPGYSVSVAFSLGGQSEERWQAGGLCRQRGQFRLGPWSVVTGDPFGLFETRGEGGQVADLLVYPPLGRVPEVPLQFGQASGSRSHMQRSLDQTVTSASVRQYSHGDPPRYIHWPTSARLRELMVKDFDLEPAGDLWIALDLNAAAQAGELDESTEEYMVLAAAAMAARALRRNQAVGLFGYGTERLYLPPGRGESQYWQVMRALAMVRADGNVSIGRVLEQERWNLGRTATVVVFASSANTDLPIGLETVRRMGASVSLFLFAAGTFGGADDLPTMVGQLQRLEVRHWVFERDHEILPLSRRERMRRRPRRDERWGLRGHASTAQKEGW